MSKKEKPATCGNCHHWAEIEQEPAQRLLHIGQPPRGLCWAMPPTPHPMYDGKQFVGTLNLRPAMRADESCSLFDERETAPGNDVN